MAVLVRYSQVQKCLHSGQKCFQQVATQLLHHVLNVVSRYFPLTVSGKTSVVVMCHIGFMADY